MRFLAQAVLAVYSLTTVSAVFLDQPPAGCMMFPIRTSVLLNCTVDQGYIQRWIVYLSDLVASSRDIIDVIRLRSRGIEVQESPSLTASYLVFTGQLQVQATVMCIAASESTGDQTVGNQVKVIIYGPPPAPINLTVTASSLGSLNISWSLDFIEGVPVNFTLTAINLNVSNAQPVVILGIQDQRYHIFTVENSSSCAVYSFQVIAVTGAGVSDPSEEITKSIPSLPDIARIQSSINYSLTKSSSEFMLRITLKDGGVCPEYPVVSYTITLVESVQRIIISGRNAVIIVGNLTEDLVYIYHVVATNMFGNSHESTPIKLITSDVQRVSICLVGGTTYSIQCSYVMGSDACGCVYFITGADHEMRNITGTIARGNFEGATVELPDFNNYSEVLAYDWDKEGPNGTLPVRTDINSSTIMICPILTTTTTTTITTNAGTASMNAVCSTTTILASVLTAISTALLATVIFVLMQIALCKCRFKATPRGAESAPSAGGEGQVMFEQVDAGGEGGVAAVGPTYMEVQAVKKDTFALKSNEAYGSVH